ncbi:MAG: hypothetical protein EOM73_15535, partial [Bacteroidia bacterium]|nr:hypothetical protein [Bacteroidia bacterium]
MGNEQDIALGLLSAPHLGDTICTSVLPRLIYEHRGIKPYVVDHPTTRAVFTNNPYIAGFSDRRGCRLSRRLSGDGHVIQRLVRGFGFEPQEMPKGEIYLSDTEREWALNERSHWGQRPICLVSLRAITDGEHYDNVDWRIWGEFLEKEFTIIQPVLTSAEEYKTNFGENYSYWPEEHLI